MPLIACCKPRLLLRSLVTKTLLCFKVTSFLLLSICISVRANTYAQNVTLSEKDVSLDKIFLEIKRQTGFTFVYTEVMLKKAKKVTIQVSNATLESVLTQCFHDQPLSYTILNKMVVIKEKEKTVSITEQENGPIAIPVVGKITNENNEPLAGASVAKREPTTPPLLRRMAVSPSMYLKATRYWYCLMLVTCQRK